MTLTPADLAAYRERIGWDGAGGVDRATLETIVLGHALAIPFENLDPLTGIVPDLTPDALVAKLVRGGRGGYCYEHNGLLKAVLDTLGFGVTGLAARVMWGADGVVRGRTHMVLLVDLPGGPAIADVGFGTQTLTGVLDLVDRMAQPTPHGDFRLVRDGAIWREDACVAGEWRPVYAFDLQPQLPPDYAIANWWSATAPGSHFTTALTATRNLPDRRLALHDFVYAVHVTGGPSERRTLSGPAAVCDLLQSDFGISLPDRAGLEARLEDIAA